MHDVQLNYNVRPHDTHNIEPAMNPKRRRLIIIIGAIFGAGFVHSVLPSWDIWIRAAVTGAAAFTIAGLLTVLLPHPSKV